MRVYVAAALLLAFYWIPWVVNPGASLTPNAYDLAEWASVHPAVQAQTPMLLTSFLLRLPLACLALLIAFGTRRSAIAALVVVIGAAGLLPPPEFIRATGDPNYQQKALLAVLTLVGSILGLSGLLARYRRWIVIGIALVGMLASAIGLAQGLALMQELGLATQPGAGGIGAAITFLVVAITTAMGDIGQKRLHQIPALTTVENQTG